MKRSLWKLPFIHSVFFKKRPLHKNFNKFVFRNSVIPLNCLNKNIKVYNGIWFLNIDITKHKIGRKFGEFSFTKRCDAQIQSRRKTKKKSKKKK